MKLFLITITLFICLTGCLHNTYNQHDTDSQGQNTDIDTSAGEFNADYAKRLGADDYGMRQYVMAYLIAGPNRDQDSTEAARLQQAHMDNINRMANDGKLVLAGPFLDDSPIRGIYIFAVETIEEAKELTASDPAIQAGRLQMELHPWYGSAALMEVNSIHEEIAKIKF